MPLDRRERSGELPEALMMAQEGHAANLWTALPGIIQSFDPAARTCVVQPTIQALVTNPDGSTQWVTLPVLVDCPVQFAQGGGVVLTFPITQGDECLVVFASRCIDSWWQSGGIQVQAELRMHSLSDGFVLPGVRSKPNVEGAISTTEAQLRSVDGTTKVRLNPSSHTVVTETTGAKTTVAPNDVKLEVGTTTFELTPTGFVASAGGTAGINMTANALTLTGTSISIAGRDFMTHHHTDPQGGNTGNVV